MQKKFKRSFEEIAHIVDETEAFFSRAGINPSLRTSVDLCIEELFVNMVTYNTESEQDILLELRAIENGIEVGLTDFDVDRFDPTELQEVDVNAPLAERTPGGLGVYLVLKMVDSIHYEYHDRQSKITFQIRAGNQDV